MPPLTPEQKEARKRYIGGSDIAAIVGADPYKNASDVWLDKTGRLEEGKTSEPAETGHDLEDAIMRMCSRKIGKPIMTGIPTLFDSNGIFCVNLDGAVLAGQPILKDGCGIVLLNLTMVPQIEAVVEAKSTIQKERWGDSIDDVPLNVICQANWEMMHAGCEIAWIPVYFPAYKKMFQSEVYRAARADDLILEMRQTGERFWEYVIKDLPPPADFSEVAHVETLQRRRRIQGEIVSLKPEISEAWANMAKTKERISHLESDVEHYRRIILSALGDAEAGRLEDGALLTYFEQNGARHADLDALQVELMELARAVYVLPADAKLTEPLTARLEGLFDKVVRQGKHRTLRYKKPRVKAPR